MNKYLLMSAAAALAATAGSGVAQASSTVHLGTSGGGTYCDYFIITKNAGGLLAGKHVGAAFCSNTVLNDPAYKAGNSTAVFGVKGKSYGFADTVFAYAGVSNADGLDFVFALPIALETSKWAILANTTGSTTYILNHGVTTNKVRPGKHESSLAKAIQALKVSK